MKYPKFMREINKWAARVSGSIVFGISALAVMEALLRQFFASPTKWSLNISCFVFIWALFLGSAYAFQEHGHVAVDLLRDLIDKKTAPSRMVRRVLAIIGYCISAVVIVVFMYGGWKLCEKAISMNALAPVTFYYPMIWIYPAIVVGCVLMLATLFFMILDLFSGSEEHL